MAASTYFLAIQDEFVRLRGTPFLLASTDFEISRAWRDGGIPLEIVLDAMRAVLEDREPDRTRIRGLKFVDSAVWKAWRALGGSAPASVVSQGDRLSLLASAVRQTRLPGAVELAEAVESVDGSVADQEGYLRNLDRKLLDAARAELGSNWLAASRRRAQRALAALKPRLTDEQWQRECEAWVAENAREVLQLPHLSLFG